MGEQPRECGSWDPNHAVTPGIGWLTLPRSWQTVSMPSEKSDTTTRSQNKVTVQSATCCAPILGSVLGAEEAAELAVLLKALADPVRLRLVSIIAGAGEACACDFPGILGKSQPTISHHLSLLVSAGILEREQRGKWAWFNVCSSQMELIRTALGSEPS